MSNIEERRMRGMKMNPEICERLNKVFLDRFQIDLSNCDEEILNSHLLVRYKLGFEIDCFNLTNVQFDWSRTQEEKRMIS